MLKNGQTYFANLAIRTLQDFKSLAIFLALCMRGLRSVYYKLIDWFLYNKSIRLKCVERKILTHLTQYSEKVYVNLFSQKSFTCSKSTTRKKGVKYVQR